MCLGIFSIANNIGSVYAQCPYGNNLTIKLRHRRLGRKCDGRCILADDIPYSFFRSYELKKAGCPRSDGWFSGNPQCKFRNGNWVELA